jgi:hypothetical protein
MTESLDKSWNTKLEASEYCKHFFDTSALKLNFDRVSGEKERVNKPLFNALIKTVGVHYDETDSISFFLETCDEQLSVDFMDCLLIIGRMIKKHIEKMTAKSNLHVLTSEFAMLGPGTDVSRAIDLIMKHGVGLCRKKVVDYVLESARFCWNPEHFVYHEREMK